MTSHECYQCNTKRKVELHENKCRKLHFGAVILGLKIKLFQKRMYWIPLFFLEFQ